MSQEQLARDLEVTFGTVNGWENGKHRPIQALATRLMRLASDAGVEFGVRTLKEEPARSRPRRRIMRKR